MSNSSTFSPFISFLCYISGFLSEMQYDFQRSFHGRAKRAAPKNAILHGGERQINVNVTIFEYLRRAGIRLIAADYLFSI